MVHVAVEAMPAGNKPPAAVGERISKGERHEFGAAAPFSTKTSSLQERAESSAFTPKLVEHIGSGLTRFAEKLSDASLVLLWRCPPCARESWCLRARLPPWRHVAAERTALALLHDDSYFSNPP